MKKLLLALAAMVVLGLCSAAALVAYAQHWFSSYNSDQTTEVVLEVAPGTGLSAIVDDLEASGLIDDISGMGPLMFKAMVAWHGKAAQFKAGEYQFDLYMRPIDIMNKMVAGESVVYAVTVPEGKTSAEALAIVAAHEALQGAITSQPAEGTLMPDTYHIHRRDARSDVIARMQKAMQDYIAENWPKRSPDLPISTPQEWVVLASVVEAETGVAAERPKVASVFINRLRKAMPLQSDPTVVYGIERSRGVPMGRALLKKDLEINHPYNTYIHAGLPPGPICNPGRASLEAVLKAPQTDYLYFVATGDGGHHFARTLAEHNANVTKYRAVVRKWRAEQKQKQATP